MRERNADLHPNRVVRARWALLAIPIVLACTGIPDEDPDYTEMSENDFSNMGWEKRSQETTSVSSSSAIASAVPI